MKIEVAVQTPEAPAVVKPTVTAPAATPIYKKLTTYGKSKTIKCAVFSVKKTVSN